MKIDIFTCAGDNGDFFSNILYESLHKFKNKNTELNFKAIINSCNFNNIKNWSTVFIETEILKINNYPNKKGYNLGSYNHGYCLNKIIDYIETDYFVIADCDTSVLKQNWDEILLDKIKYNFKAAGVSLFLNRKHQIITNFPCVVFCMYETKTFKKLKPNFLPKIVQTNDKVWSIDKKIVKGKNDRHLYGLEEGMHFSCDTGWELPPLYRSNNYDGFCFDKKINLSEFQAWNDTDDTNLIAHCDNSRYCDKNKMEKWRNFNV